MYILIIFLPLLGTLFTGFCGRWLGSYGSSILATSCVAWSMILSYLAFFEIILNNTKVQINLLTWINSGLILVNWGLLFDTVTTIMLIVITTISSLVHLYSIEYMSNDPHLPRFMSYLEIFTFFMLILVTSDNLLQMFLGWEGVGIASYLLINFWFTRLAANQSALKALIMNRVGDFGLLLAILLIFVYFKSFDYSVIFPLVPLFVETNLVIFQYKINIITAIGLLLFVGALGKSAQLGLHTWLPDAMEGPTPVSALIHAATMVTAGVFLLIRFSPLIEFSLVTLTILIVFGSLTALFASIVGIFQNDIKRVIAYSTCSQLGYMIFSCGMTCYNVSLFHLTNHAFFKALLFLSAGSVIHALSDEQDMRRMGSLIKFLPVTYVLMLIGSLALVGFPFLTGFYSKDVILELTQVLRNSNISNFVSNYTNVLGNIAAFFTAYYSFRLLYLTFLNNINTTRITILNIHESSYMMLIPLLILGLGSLFVGFLMKDLIIGLGTDIWKNSIFSIPRNNYFIEAEFLNINLKWIPFILSLISLLLVQSVMKYFRFNLLNLETINFFAFLINKKWFFDFFYNKLFVNTILKLGYTITFKNLDRGFVELLGPYGISILIKKWSHIIIQYHTGLITHYILYIILGVVFNILLFNYNDYLISIYLILIFFI